MLILQDMLPDHIPMRLGESVLFAGKAIRVLRNPSPAFQFQKDKSFQQTMRGSQRIRGFMHSDFSEKETELDADLTGEELLPQSEADKIEAMLKDLKVLVGRLSHGLFRFHSWDTFIFMFMIALVFVSLTITLYLNFKPLRAGII